MDTPKRKTRKAKQYGIKTLHKYLKANSVKRYNPKMLYLYLEGFNEHIGVKGNSVQLATINFPQWIAYCKSKKLVK